MEETVNGQVSSDTSQKDTKSTSNTPFGDMCDEMCPYYMSLGISYDEFWHGDYCKFKYYVKKHEYDTEDINTKLWLQGMYNYKAFEAVMNAFSYGMSGGKGKKPNGYMEYPHPFTEREKAAEKQRKIEHTLRFVAKGNE